VRPRGGREEELPLLVVASDEADGGLAFACGGQLYRVGDVEAFKAVALESAKRQRPQCTLSQLRKAQRWSRHAEAVETGGAQLSASRPIRSGTTGRSAGQASTSGALLAAWCLAKAPLPPPASSFADVVPLVVHRAEGGGGLEVEYAGDLYRVHEPAALEAAAVDFTAVKSSPRRTLSQLRHAQRQRLRRQGAAPASPMPTFLQPEVVKQDATARRKAAASKAWQLAKEKLPTETL